MYFMSTACGYAKVVEGPVSRGRTWTWEGINNLDFLVDVMNA